MPPDPLSGSTPIDPRRDHPTGSGTASPRSERSGSSIDGDRADAAGAERTGSCGCGATMRSSEPGPVVCSRCGLVYRLTPHGLTIDATATRSALFEASAVCAGSDWDLASIVWDRQPDVQSVANYRRLALAETGVASLRGRGL